MITATIIASVYAMRRQLGFEESDDDMDEEEREKQRKAAGTEMKVVKTKPAPIKQITEKRSEHS